MTPEILDSVRRIVQEQALPSSRQYYLAPLQQALFIIEEADITFSNEGITERPSFMFRMYDAYEDFIRNLVADIMREKGYNVFNGNKRHIRELYDPRSEYRYRLKPDIVISNSMQDVGIIDVKYKSSLESSDHYQLWIYKQQYDVDKAGLISIPDVNSETSVENYTRNRFGDSIQNFRYSMADFSTSNSVLEEFLRELFGF